MQSCLAQAVGPWVPQDGVLGPGTRQAIRTFQEQQQIPATGLLDEGTVTALRIKYSGRQDAAPPAVDAQPSDGPPPDVQSSGEPAAAPEAAPANQSDPEGEVSDVLLGRREGEAEREREFSVQSPCRVLLKWSKPKKISDLVDKTDPLSVRYLPEESGLYVIMGQNGKPWYVGVAEAGIRGRFQERMKTLRDFNIAQDLLVKIFDREIMWAKAVLVRKPVCVLVRSGEGKKDSTHTLKQPTAPLLIAEQFYIDRLKTYGRGNRVGEIVRFENTGELTIKSVFEDDAGRQRLADAKDPKGLKQLFDSRQSVNKK